MKKLLSVLNPWRTARMLRSQLRLARHNADHERKCVAERDEALARKDLEIAQARRAFWAAIDSNHGRLRVRHRSLQRAPQSPMFRAEQDETTGDIVYISGPQR